VTFGNVLIRERSSQLATCGHHRRTAYNVLQTKSVPDLVQ
jgi:hypothetical protein